MRNRENERLSTADLAGRAEEREAGRSDEQTINRGMAEPAYADVPESAREPAPQPDTRPRNEKEVRPSSEQAREYRADQQMSLFANDERMKSRQRWSDIQAGFVDEPRAAVQRADALVAETMQRLAQVFAGARQQLEHQWDRGEDVTTEDLRVALQRYRAFFDRLLAI